MTKKADIQAEIVKQYLEKYPKLPSQTIARMVLSSEKGHLFKNLDAVRSSVRYYRGARGEQNRAKLEDYRFVTQVPEYDTRFGIPRAKEYNYEPYYVDDQRQRGVIITDIHVPYHDVEMLTTAILEARSFNPDFVILDEVLDFYQVSKFRKDPGKPDVKEELQTAREMFTAFRVSFPDAEIIYHFGNHDDRWKYWLWDHPEIYNIPEIQLEALLGIDALGIEVVTDKRTIIMGELTYCHGHEFWTSLVNPVNPARGLFLKGKEIAACGHFHQTSEHTEPTIHGKMITCWSIGCACQLHPEYMPINRWNHGLATIEKVPSGEFKFDNIRILNGKIL